MALQLQDRFPLPTNVSLYSLASRCSYLSDREVDKGWDTVHEISLTEELHLQRQFSLRSMT